MTFTTAQPECHDPERDRGRKSTETNRPDQVLLCAGAERMRMSSYDTELCHRP